MVLSAITLEAFNFLIVLVVDMPTAAASAEFTAFAFDDNADPGASEVCRNVSIRTNLEVIDFKIAFFTKVYCIWSYKTCGFVVID